MKTLQIDRGDVVRGISGRCATVVDRDKANQALSRLLGLAAPEGAGLDALVGKTFDSEFSFSAKLQANVRVAFERLTGLQRTFGLARRTPAERLVSLRRIYVTTASLGAQPTKTGYVFRVDAGTAAGTSVASGGLLVP